MTDLPQYAKQQAVDEANAITQGFCKYTLEDFGISRLANGALKALAAMIAKYEPEEVEVVEVPTKRVIDVQDWAAKRACELSNAISNLYGPGGWTPDDVGSDEVLTAFALYIQQHEQPPVDPDLELAREVYAVKWAELPHMVANCLAGEFDDTADMLMVLAGIKAADKRRSGT